MCGSRLTFPAIVSAVSISSAKSIAASVGMPAQVSLLVQSSVTVPDSTDALSWFLELVTEWRGPQRLSTTADKSHVILQQRQQAGPKCAPCAVEVWALR